MINIMRIFFKVIINVKCKLRPSKTKIFELTSYSSTRPNKYVNMYNADSNKINVGKFI